jgi:hypothetical protein
MVFMLSTSDLSDLSDGKTAGFFFFAKELKSFPPIAK